ncbi:MAG TPA: arabinofuranosidase catalytic domain-containing protein [Actinocrinis sp.]|nr:arabinofuranosidase catalytic domain-containing protein [Actinocrinis sp.]
MNAPGLAASSGCGETGRARRGAHRSRAGAVGAPTTLNGHKAYGVFIPPGTGYGDNTVTTP